MRRILALLLMVLIVSFGCGDDDPVNGGETATCDETSPNNNYDVVSSDVVVVVDDYGNIPPQVQPYIDAWITELIGSSGDSQWNVALQVVLLTKTETPSCAPMAYAYNPLTRSCTMTTPIDLQDIDVSSLDLCETVGEPPLQATYCVTAISIDADVTPNLVWAADFKTFSGTEAIGSAQTPADVTVTVTGPLIGGDYNMSFHASRTVSGTCCAGCTVCP